MWGNRLGWFISAGMVVVTGLLWLWVSSVMAITAPTELSLNPDNMAALQPPAAIVETREPGDAGDAYRAAIGAYADSSDECQQFAAKPLGDAPKAIQLVLDATHKTGMHLFADHPEKIINYADQQPDLDQLRGLGTAIAGAGVRLRQLKHLDDARPYFDALYSLGNKLLRERLTYEEYSCGIGLESMALSGLIECETENSPHWVELTTADQTLKDFDTQHVTPIYQVLISADQQTIAANAGDIFAFATRSGERMFRVEAVLKLGRYRFDAARKADQLAAARYIGRLTADPDPAVHVAAVAAGDLKIEDYRMIH